MDDLHRDDCINGYGKNSYFTYGGTVLLLDRTTDAIWRTIPDSQDNDSLELDPASDLRFHALERCTFTILVNHSCTATMASIAFWFRYHYSQ
jgi:hypothetical protein